MPQIFNRNRQPEVRETRALKPVYAVLACLSLTVVLNAASTYATDDVLQWPTVTKERRPWTYWWWLGSAVDPPELTRHLEAYRDAGMGGVHIVPIYGAKGHEEKYISYLTPKWMEMLAHTTREAKRLDLGVDMTAGTGWPYGGPWVGPEDASARVLFERYPVSGDIPAICSQEEPEAPLRALREGDALDLTSRVDGEGRLDWDPPSGDWELIAIFQGWTKQQVKRAAPGAEGNVLDYFSKKKLHNYLSRFDEAFANFSAPPVRAFYNDSFEVYRANWTDDLFAEFKTRRGYDLRYELPALLGDGDAERVSRVRSDYRETVSDLLYEQFTQPWVEWCHGKSSQSRNQAHGSPGNLIDLYGASDIPETEGFGRGGVEILVAKLAASAAHLQHRPLASSETCTWLDEHFQVPLARVKQAVDPYFLAGINHIFYHGMPYSPEAIPFPGWLFYASTHFGITNTLSLGFPELNAYIARCQSFLQAGKPDNDLLLYLPIYDLWAVDEGSKDLLQYCTAHNSKNWLRTNMKRTSETAEWLWDRGYAFDFVSDRNLKEDLTGSPRGISTGKQTYRAVVVAGCRTIPVATLDALRKLAESGANVVFVDGLPTDVPGLAEHEERRTRLLGVSESMQTAPRNIYVGENLESMLEGSGVVRERLTDRGMASIRRVHEKYTDVFVANTNETTFDGWLPLRGRAASVVIFDPLRDVRGIARIRKAEDMYTEVRLQLRAGEACILRTLSHRIEAEPWEYKQPGEPLACFIDPWDVEFLDGGPTLPEPWKVKELRSWTERGDAASRDFSGTARYRATFNRPESAGQGWLLDLGRVYDCARVRLNGQDMGILWCEPFVLDIKQALRAGENTVEIEVANMMANRIAAMDREKVPWQNYFFVNIDYKPFDASAWEPFPSGLLGPVKLIPYTLEP